MHGESDANAERERAPEESPASGPGVGQPNQLKELHGRTRELALWAGTQLTLARRYGVAGASSGVALVLALLTVPLLGSSAAEMHLAAVMFSAWYGGPGPGLLATALGAVSLDYFFEGPQYSLDISNPFAWVQSVIVFIGVAGLISWLGGNLRRCRQRAECTQQQAQAALRVRDDVLHAVSHDLRQPLTIIRLLAGTLQDQLEEVALPHSRALRAGLARMETNAAKMASLIGDLLEVARLQEGKPLPLDREPTDLVALARQTAAEHQRGSERHIISVRTPARAVCGMWDPRRLERVLDNLLSNAIKYSPTGGSIEVEVTMPSPERAQLVVRDHGLGVPLEERSRLFDRFYRAQAAGQVVGFGLGLYICRQLVEWHGGRIAAEFPADGGTCIVVSLPLGQPTTATEDDQAHSPQTQPQPAEHAV
jgi:signal transduction histidine kinase